MARQGELFTASQLGSTGRADTPDLPLQASQLLD